MNICVATNIQICNGWKIKHGRSPQDTRSLRQNERPLSNEYELIIFPPAASQQMKMSP